jgi:hypothetical protein
VDRIREARPPFGPANVTAEAAADFHRYAVSAIRGDYYGAEWTAERFRKHGITYTNAEKPKSAIDLELLPLLMPGRVELLDHPRATHQLISRKRRRRRGRHVHSGFVTPRRGSAARYNAPGGHILAPCRVRKGEAPIRLSAPRCAIVPTKALSWWEMLLERYSPFLLRHSLRFRAERNRMGVWRLSNQF